MKTKTKLTIAVASVLSVATLAGTGYAGWVLSHNESQNKTGSMEAYGVTDKTVTLDIQDFDDPKATAKKGIAAFRRFLSSIGMPVNFAQLGAKAEDIPLLVEKFGIGAG